MSRVRVCIFWEIHVPRLTRWSHIRLALRDLFANFFGTCIMVLFGDGSVAHVLQALVIQQRRDVMFTQNISPSLGDGSWMLCLVSTLQVCTLSPQDFEDPSGRGIGDSEGFLNSTQYGFHKLKEQCFENC